MPSTEPSLLLLIPAYNEEERIGPVLREFGNYYRTNYPGRFELVVVLVGALHEALEKERGASFVDIGFGQGLGTISAGLEGAELYGVDINPKCRDVLVRNAVSRALRGGGAS